MLLLIVALLWLAAYLIAWQGQRRGRWSASYHRDVAALGFLALAALGFFWRILWGGSWMPADGGDLASFLYPTYRFIAQSFRQGVLPLWNPHLYGGAPFIGDIQAGLFYPINVLAFFLARPLTYRTMQGLSIFHFWWAGTGMYIFLRSWAGGLKFEISGLRLNRWACLAGALAFMFSDGFLTHFGNLNLIAVASWLPWVFWAYLRGLRDWRLEVGSWRLEIGWAVVAGALLGVATLAGHAQITLFIVLALALYMALELYLVWAQEPRRLVASLPRRLVASLPRRLVASLPRCLFYLLTCCLSALLLAAVVLLPSLELTRHTARLGWDYQQTVGYSLSPAQWIGLLIPGYFGRGPQFHWGLWPRVEVGYLGVLPLLLALLAVMRGGPRRMWALLGLAVTAFLIALGIYSLPHGWLVQLVPGFGQFRAPARLVLVMDFGLAALAALGLDALLRPVENDAAPLRRVFRLTAWAAGLTCGVGLPLAYFALITGQDRSAEIFSRISVAVIAVAIFAGLLLASLMLLAARRYGWARPRTLGLLAVLLIFLDLGSTGAYNDLGAEDPTRTFEHTQIIAFLRGEAGPFRIDARTGIEQLWQPDTALVYGLDDVWGVVNPLVLADYERYWEGMGSRSSPLYDFLNARFVIARKDVVLDWDKFELAFDGDPQLNVYRNRRALPRAFLVHQAVAVPDQEAAWAAVHAPGFDPATTVVVEVVGAGVGAGLRPAPTPDVPERVEIVAYGLNEIVVEVEAGAPGYLVLSEVFYPGWRVFDESGGRRLLLRANYAFRAVAVEPGTTRLHFIYAPASFRLGAAVSGVTALALLAGLVWLWRRGVGRKGAGV